MELSNENLLLIAVLAVLAVAVLVLLVAAYVVVAMHQVLQARQAAQQETQELADGQLVLTPAKPRETFWQMLDRRYITKGVALEKETDLMLDHNYDGIKELDNHLPPWWVGMFYGSIGFAAVYLLVFHVLGTAPLSEGEYLAEVEQAEIQLAEYRKKAADQMDETNVTLASTEAELAEGARMFSENCQACHGAQGQGGVGPNLTDAYWLHGGGVKEVFKVIKHGVPEKGMIAWKAKFKPVEMQQIASYILSLQGSNPANAKEPQGQLWQAETAAKDPEIKTQAAL